MQRNLIVLSGFAALALWGVFPSPASASIVTYNLIPNSSDIVVTATISGGAFHSATVDFDNSASWTLNLTSGSLTLDSGAPALNAFSFSDSSAGPETISVSGLTLGTLSLTNLLVQSDANPDAPLTGSNPYALSTSNVMDSASYVVTPTGGSAKSGGLSNRGTPMTGTIVTGGTPPVWFAQSDAIQLGTGSFTYLGTTYTLTVKGDINFEGASTVPLPPSLWLLAGGLGLLGFACQRRRPIAGIPRLS